MATYTHTDKKNGDGLAITDWNNLSNALAGAAGLRLATSNATDGVGIGQAPTTTEKLAVTGAIKGDGNLSITGTSTLSGNVTVSGTSTLTVGGASTLQGNVTVSGTSTLTVGGNSTLTGNVGLGQVPTTTEKLAVTGNVVITGDLTVTGRLNRGSGGNARPLLRQLVHRRVLWGLAGDTVLSYDSSTSTEVRKVYRPFGGYACPPVQPSASRSYQLYAIYNDGISSSDAGTITTVITFQSCQFPSKRFWFTLPRISGGTSPNPKECGDNYSETYGEDRLRATFGIEDFGSPPTGHMTISAKICKLDSDGRAWGATASPCTGKLLFLELLSFDIFQ